MHVELCNTFQALQRHLVMCLTFFALNNNMLNLQQMIDLSKVIEVQKFSSFSTGESPLVFDSQKD